MQIKENELVLLPLQWFIIQRLKDSVDKMWRLRTPAWAYVSQKTAEDVIIRLRSLFSVWEYEAIPYTLDLMSLGNQLIQEAVEVEKIAPVKELKERKVVKVPAKKKKLGNSSEGT